MGKNRELGNKGDLPAWRLPADLKRFKELTDGSVVVMGRKNYESLPERFRPLPNRKNVVLTRDEIWAGPGVEIVHTVDEVLEKYGADENLWIIGGAEIYKLFLPYVNEMHLTEVDGQFEADTFFPEFSGFEITKEEIFPADEKNSHNTIYRVYKK